MSKELIEKLREASYSASHGEMADLLHEAADALEAKAAPVGEPTLEMVQAACAAFRMDISPIEAMQNALKAALQAGAAHQCQQAREVVMPDAEGSAAQKSFWAGFESASLRLFGTNIRAAWNSYKASDEFARLNKGAGSHE